MEHRLALAVEPDVEILDQLQTAFGEWHVDVRAVENGVGLEQALQLPGVRYVIACSGDASGAIETVLGQLAGMEPKPVVMVLAPSQDGDAARWIDRGLFDLLPTPLDSTSLNLAIRRAVRQQQLLTEVQSLRRELRTREGYHGLVGRSQPMERLREELARLAASDGPVWLHGESGCGKKLAARTLHERSGRGQAPFVVLDCEAESAEGRFESRLTSEHNGEAAPHGIWNGLHGGTLMVSEPGALDPTQQRTLLDAQERARSAGIDARCVVVSRLSPEQQVEEGRLIGELVGRLAIDALHLRPLRERREDIPLLAAHFLETICAINRLSSIRIGADAMRSLEGRHWSDNVRGLRNAIEHAAIVCQGGTIEAGDLAPGSSSTPSTISAPGRGAEGAPNQTFRQAKGQVVEAFELDYLCGLMRRHVGNVTAASQEAGMLRSALQRLLRKYGLKSSNFRQPRGAQANQASEETHASES